MTEEQILKLARDCGVDMERMLDSTVVEFARAILAQSAQSASAQPAEPDQPMFEIRDAAGQVLSKNRPVQWVEKSRYGYMWSRREAAESMANQIRAQGFACVVRPVEPIAARRMLAASPADQVERYRHKKSGGIYQALVPLAYNESDQAKLVVYRSEETGFVWVRPHGEFHDKFEAMSASAQQEPANPYAAQGSLEEAWQRGFDGQRGLAAPGSNYDKVWHEGAAARKAYDAGRAAPATASPAEPQSDRTVSQIMEALKNADNERALSFSAKEMRAVLNLWNSAKQLAEGWRNQAAPSASPAALTPTVDSVWQKLDDYAQRRTSPENVADVLNALAASPADQAGWQPIETAPKDGSHIILWWGDASVVGWWLDNTNTRTPWAGWRVPSLQTVPYGCKPTHWMTLPTAPAMSATPPAAEEK